MTKRHPEEVILARWTVDGARLREFTRQVRERHEDSPFPPRDLLKACDEARGSLEVVYRDDAVFVGPWCLSFTYNEVSGIRVEEPWVLFIMEGGSYDIPVPIARDGLAEAIQVGKLYRRLWEEEDRLAREKRAAPTWSNWLLDIFEAHPAWMLLGFFFVLIPAVVAVMGWLQGKW
jgi:hypothetical protein